MPAQKIDSLTLAETAYVSDVTVRDVNRVIDEKILPGGFYAVGSGRARRFKVGACALIAFYFMTAGRLTSGERIRAISRAGQRLRKSSPARPEKEWTISDDLLQIKLTPFLKGVRKRLSKLAAPPEFWAERRLSRGQGSQFTILQPQCRQDCRCNVSWRPIQRLRRMLLNSRSFMRKQLCRVEGRIRESCRASP
jgi:hypothetical protein